MSDNFKFLSLLPIMAYSMLSRPKLKNLKEARYHPENEYPVDQNYHQLHHTYGQNGEGITIDNIPRKHKIKKDFSTKTRAASERKCPIYIHPIENSLDYNISPYAYKKVTNYLNDLYSVEQEPNIKNEKNRQNHNTTSKKSDINKKAVISKLEESYWANWKPQKDQNYGTIKEISPKFVRSKSPSKKKGKTKLQNAHNDNLQTMVARYCKSNIEKSPVSEDSERTRPTNYNLNEKRSKSSIKQAISQNTEIQTEFAVKDAETLSRIEEEIHSKYLEGESSESELAIEENKENADFNQKLSDQSDSDGSPARTEETEKEIIELNETQSSTDKIPVRESSSNEDLTIEEDSNRLRHTDSLILTKKKQNSPRTHYQQPKCIRLYKKPGPSTTTGCVRGGSYPLKSCLKKESSFGSKRNIRLGRPGSPLIVTSNYYSNFSRSYRK